MRPTCLRLIALALILACTPGNFISLRNNTPTSVPPTSTALPPTSTSTPTATPTPRPTFTPTPIPAPVGVKFIFDDGVSERQRQIIRDGVGLAQQYLGDAGSVTVFAYASLDSLVGELASRNHIAPNSPAAKSMREGFENSIAARESAGMIYAYVSTRWIAASESSRLHTMAHEYFHALQSAQSHLHSGMGANWLIEGSADYAAIKMLADYKYVDLGLMQRQRIDRARGLLNPLRAMEDSSDPNLEDETAKYNLGYLASEYLASIAGDEAVLHKYWTTLQFVPLWPTAFKTAFGLDLDEFYTRFEEYRRNKFPPICGAVGDPLPTNVADALSIKPDRQREPGSFMIVSNVKWVPHTFCVTGFRVTSLTSSQWYRAFALPDQYSGLYSCGGNCLIVSMRPDAPSGTYTLGITLPDGRKAETKFEHVGISGTPTPRP